MLREGEGGRPPGDRASPAIRAIQTRTMVEAFPSLDAGQRERILARATPAVLERARRSFSMAWFPMGDHMHLCGIVYDVVGPDVFMRLLGDAFVGAIRTPMLRGIFGMISRVSDDSVATLLRNAPRLYGYVTRDIGRLEATFHGPGQATLEVSGWPSSQFDFEVWLVGTKACIDGALRGVGARGATIEIDESIPERGYGTYRVRW